MVLLQFGHNDSRSAISANRYDLAGIGDEVETIAGPGTGEKIQIHTFGYYLRQMIDEGRAAGATVIVLSPVPRCKWADGKVVRGEENHGPWAAEVARAKGVPFVDVNAIVADVYDAIGRPPGSRRSIFRGTTPTPIPPAPASTPRASSRGCCNSRTRR